MADIVTSRIFTDGEKGITAAKLNDIIASSVIQPAFVGSKPVTSTVNPNDNLLVLQSTNQYAQAPFSTIVSSVQSQLPSTDSEIWSVRLRSFNAVGNPTFEVDQRNVGNALTNPPNGTLIQDRWAVTKATATLGYFAQRITPVAPILIPGTNFAITNGYLRLTLTAQQTTLAAGDFFRINQSIEGPYFRELSNDVHSVSLLVRSSVSGLKFSFAVSDNPATKSLVKLCTITSGVNAWMLIPLPNLPVWPAGNFTVGVGANGYLVYICLAAGSSATAPAVDTWQNGNFVGAPGMSNFAASPVNSTFDIAFVQHEPGNVCSTLMDKPFTQNYDECLRYFCKSYDYATAISTGSAAGYKTMTTMANSSYAMGPLSFPKPMAKDPNVQIWAIDGTVNSATALGAGNVGSITSFPGVGQTGFCGLTGIFVANTIYQFHYKADTGW